MLSIIPKDKKSYLNESLIAKDCLFPTFEKANSRGARKAPNFLV